MPIKLVRGELYYSQENTKLGHIENFSIMPGKDCPGETPACIGECYAAKGTCKAFAFHYWAHNSKIVRRNPHKVLDLVSRIRGPVFRIHVGGDFFNREYIEAWTKVALLRSDVKFWTYTRSWRIKKMVKSLKYLNRLPNVTIWASCDKDTLAPPRGFKRAYMSLTDQDLPSYNTDLIFRVQRNTCQARLAGTIICPVENGFSAGKELNCKKCGICFR